MFHHHLLAALIAVQRVELHQAPFRQLPPRLAALLQLLRPLVVPPRPFQTDRESRPEGPHPLPLLALVQELGFRHHLCQRKLKQNFIYIIMLFKWEESVGS